MNKEYRILGVAIVLFVAGVFFFYADRFGGSRDPAAAVPEKHFQVSEPPSSLDPVLSTFPTPSIFGKIAYDGGGINGKSSWTVTTSCHDAFVAILIFPAGVDYRADATRAVFNKAFGCTVGQDFSYAIQKNSLGNIPKGDYYIILADQGTRGMWYNPR